MNHESFNLLLTKVRPLIERQNTKLWLAVPAEERPVLTLCYVATGILF